MKYLNDYFDAARRRTPSVQEDQRKRFVALLPSEAPELSGKAWMKGFNIPVSLLVVGGLAALMILLYHWFGEEKGTPGEGVATMTAPSDSHGVAGVERRRGRAVADGMALLLTERKDSTGISPTIDAERFSGREASSPELQGRHRVDPDKDSIAVAEEPFLLTTEEAWRFRIRVTPDTVYTDFVAFPRCKECVGMSAFRIANSDTLPDSSPYSSYDWELTQDEIERFGPLPLPVLVTDGTGRAMMTSTPTFRYQRNSVEIDSLRMELWRRLDTAVPDNLSQRELTELLQEYDRKIETLGGYDLRYLLPLQGMERSSDERVSDVDVVHWYSPSREVLSRLPDRLLVNLQSQLREEETDDPEMRTIDPVWTGEVLRVLDSILDVRSVDGGKASPVSEPPIRGEIRIGTASMTSGGLQLTDVRTTPDQSRLLVSYNVKRSRKITFTVTDLQGRHQSGPSLTELVEEGEGETLLDIESLSSGMYLLSIHTDAGEQVTGRFVKKSP